MTTIEDKISLFSKIIYDKVNEEKNEKVEALNSEIEKKLDVEKEKIDELRRNLQIEVTKKSNSKANGIVAKERLNKHREILFLKDKLICDTLENVRKKLVQFVGLPEYKLYFINALQKTLKEIDKGNYYIVVLKRDNEKFNSDIQAVISEYHNLNVKILISEVDFIGGVVVKDFEGKFKIDNSIESKLQDSKELIGVRVMEMLA
ncbi:V-type ATP synthase subunit E [Clostridium sp.]|uniref:V-type ATP synthase subunit E n=1 Tax=Clostridium sp. TaxID=1506 RepID=UPI001A5E602D|nr:V-type ATP synthase subunit E [Clostridium sp.]MBK5242768.1 V-type ATP synthase subunit E [Clostridium sp.]